MVNIAFCFGNKFLVVRDCVVHVFCILLKGVGVISSKNMFGSFSLFVIYNYLFLKIIFDDLQY